MVIMNYRFHKFTCSRIKGHNGKSPLELAGVNTTGINWISFLSNTNGIHSQNLIDKSKSRGLTTYREDPIKLAFLSKFGYNEAKEVFAGVAELVDALDSKSSEVFPREGSTPSSGTRKKRRWKVGFFDKITAKIRQAAEKRKEADFIPFKVRCEKCGEEITINVNRRTDLQNLYLEPGEKGAAFNLKKEILGKKCPNLIRIDVDFDHNYKIISRDISGGSFIE